MASFSLSISILTAGFTFSSLATAETVALVCTPTSGAAAIHWVFNDKSVVENGIQLGFTAPVFTEGTISWKGLVRPTAPGSSAAYASDISINIDRNSTAFSRDEVYRGPQGIISEKSVKGTCALEPKGKKTF